MLKIGWVDEHELCKLYFRAYEDGHIEFDVTTKNDYYIYQSDICEEEL